MMIPTRRALVIVLASAPLACSPSESADTSPGDEQQAAAESPRWSEDAAPADEAPLNALTDEERTAGFELLFDSETLAGWRGFQRDSPPLAWIVEDGTIHFSGSGDGGDLLTEASYGDFELRLQWRVDAGGNSGIFFRIDEKPDRTFESAPEMQVLDNQGHPDGRNPLTSAGANYGLHAPTANAVYPAGEWNYVRLVVQGAHVEHWLNGVKIVEYELWTPEWEELVSQTKFAEWPPYGRATAGHIGLQDHGDPVWYRNIRIRRLGK